MATYREKIRAFRRCQCADLRRSLAFYEAVAQGFGKFYDVRMTRDFFRMRIDEIMYAPMPAGVDDEAPDHWHPGGPHIDGSKLIEEWA